MVKGIEPNYDFINKHGTNPIMLAFSYLLLFCIIRH